MRTLDLIEAAGLLKMSAEALRQRAKAGELRAYKPGKRCGLDDFRWHDLRHTWASWHVQAGTPLHALMELGGWKDAAMVRKYAHFSASHLQQFAENTVRRAESDTNPAQRKA